MNDQPMCQRPDIYCGKCDTCNPTNMTREQRIQELLREMSEDCFRHPGIEDRLDRAERGIELLAAFLVDKVLEKVEHPLIQLNQVCDKPDCAVLHQSKPIKE